jgi:hypothetical protein
MKTVRISSVFLTLLLFFSFVFTPQVLSTEMKTQGDGPKILVVPLDLSFRFSNIGNEVIHNLTIMIHIYGGWRHHVNRIVRVFINNFTKDGVLAISYEAFSGMYGFGRIDCNISINCDNISGIPYTIYPGHIWFLYLVFSQRDPRVLPIQE